jgi:molecular chaperone GrpE
MQRKIDIEGDRPDPDGPDSRRRSGSEENPEIKVTDRRHWQMSDEEVEAAASAEPARTSVVDEYRLRAEEAERKLLEYIDAHKRFRAEQEQVRVRLTRDVERRVELRFAELVGGLLGTLDTLDLALRHAEEEGASVSLIDGVRLARDQFLDTLLKAGVERVAPDGAAFDPNVAEAVRVDPVDALQDDGVVTETLRPGYRLGDSLIRPAQVAVGRHDPQA